MRISTKIVLDWDGNVLERESFEYSGPVALCDRKTANQLQQQKLANIGQDQANAQTELGATNTALNKYSSNLDAFMKFGRDTYGDNGEFMRDENTIANTTASAGGKAIGGNLALDRMRTGANDANFASTAAESQRQGERDLTSQLAGADATRLQNLTAINQYGVDASKFPAQIQSQLYGTSIGGTTGAAPNQPGFWDANGGQVIGGGAAAAGTVIAAAV